MAQPQYQQVEPAIVVIVEPKRAAGDGSGGIETRQACTLRDVDKLEAPLVFVKRVVKSITATHQEDVVKTVSIEIPDGGSGNEIGPQRVNMTDFLIEDRRVMSESYTG